MKRVAGFAALALSAPSAATTVEVDSLEAIPQEYRGRWDGSAEACRHPAGRQRLELGATSLKVGGDAFQAESIGWDSDGGVAVHSLYAGAGRTWGRFDHFYLSKDGQTMVRMREQRRFPLVRCRSR